MTHSPSSADPMCVPPGPQRRGGPRREWRGAWCRAFVTQVQTSVLLLGFLVACTSTPTPPPSADPALIIFQTAPDASIDALGGLYRLDLATGAQTLLSRRADEVGPLTINADFAPRTNRLAYIASADTDGDLVVVDLASETQQVRVSGTQRPSFVDWAPDGEHLAWVARDDDGYPQAYLGTATGTEAHRLALDPPLVVYQVRWSPTGDALAVVVKHPADAPEDNRLVVVTRDGAVRSALGPRSFLSLPVWAPEGQHLLYTEQRSGGNTPLYRWDLATDTHHLLADAGYTVAAAWAPASTQIAFTASATVNAGPRLFLVNADGSDLQQVGPDNRSVGMHLQPWSADGQCLSYLTVAAAATQIQVRDLQRDVETTVLALPGFAAPISWIGSAGCATVGAADAQR